MMAVRRTILTEHLLALLGHTSTGKSSLASFLGHVSACSVSSKQTPPTNYCITIVHARCLNAFRQCSEGAYSSQIG